jgi:outer membrane immunogenic protein
MGSNGVTFPRSAIAVGRSDNIRQDVDMGTVQMNYHFGTLAVRTRSQLDKKRA